MRRREFITFLSSAALAWPCIAIAQTASRPYRVGLLGPGQSLSERPIFLDAIIRGLAKHGYTPGHNLAFESRGAQGHADRLPRLVDELVKSKVDVILTIGYPVAMAAKRGTTTVPIVVTEAGGDPVATGLVDSLSRPGGNLTGVSDMAFELAPKRLQLIKEIVPGLRRVAVLWNAADLGMTVRYRAAAEAAEAIGVFVQPLGVREPKDFEEAFAAMMRDPPDAILTITDVLVFLNRRPVFEFAAAHRVPSIYERETFVRDGGLMSYAADYEELFDRAASLVDRILKGAEPGGLPFEQPTRFRLVVNLKTAKALGLTIPQSIILRADEVIE